MGHVWVPSYLLILNLVQNYPFGCSWTFGTMLCYFGFSEKQIIKTGIDMLEIWGKHLMIKTEVQGKVGRGFSRQCESDTSDRKVGGKEDGVREPQTIASSKKCQPGQWRIQEPNLSVRAFLHSTEMRLNYCIHCAWSLAESIPWEAWPRPRYSGGSKGDSDCGCTSNVFPQQEIWGVHLHGHHKYLPRQWLREMRWPLRSFISMSFFKRKYTLLNDLSSPSFSIDLQQEG